MKDWKWFLFGAIGAILLALLASRVWATGNDHENGQVKICHWTRTHWVVNHPNKNGNVSGHDNHGNDIIPPFFYWYNPPGPIDWFLAFYAGKNWDSEGREIWHNDCEVPEPEPTPTPTPTVEPTPEPTPTEEPKEEEPVNNCAPGVPFVGPYCGWSPKPEEHQATAPVCPDKPPEKLGTNFHVYRKGSDAILKWWPGDGKNVNIYYKQNGSNDWQYSVIGIENSGYYEIHDLDNLDITFALEEVNGCGGGTLIHAVVDGASDGWVLWR